MTAVKYLGPYLDHSGYGEATRNFITALSLAGADIVTEKVSFVAKPFDGGPTADLADALSKKSFPYRIKIMHVTPDLYPKYIEKGKYNIGHLFWETDRLPSSWTPHCNMVNEIWTGDDRQKEAFIRSGVKVPIYVCPQPVDTSLVRAKPFKLKHFDNGLIFYSIFEWIERKNPRALLESFWKEFRIERDVALLLKVSRGDYEEEGLRQITADVSKWKASMGFDTYPRVFICKSLLSREDLIRFHSTGHCFVSAHRGEGWGLPQAEATILSNPIISTAVGGIHEYLKPATYKAVKFKMVPVTKNHNKYYEPGMMWAEVDEDDLKYRMRSIYNWYAGEHSKGLVKGLGAKARNYATMRFGYVTIGTQLLGRLSEIEKNL